MKYFIANWKANKNLSEAIDWSDNFIKLINSNSRVYEKLKDDLMKIIICPPYPLIYPLKNKFKDYKNIELGAQDISIFENGIYTGEVTALNLKGLINYVIIGHSERKKNNFENLDSDKKKIANALKYKITPLYCIADTSIDIPEGVNFICFEPPDAISNGDGNGNFLTAELILQNKEKIKSTLPYKFIYGGSVNNKNINEYLKYPNIDGFLIGGTSLNYERFFEIIEAV